MVVDGKVREPESGSQVSSRGRGRLLSGSSSGDGSEACPQALNYQTLASPLELRCEDSVHHRRGAESRYSRNGSANAVGVRLEEPVAPLVGPPQSTEKEGLGSEVVPRGSSLPESRKKSATPPMQGSSIIHVRVMTNEGHCSQDASGEEGASCAVLEPGTALNVEQPQEGLDLTRQPRGPLPSAGSHPSNAEAVAEHSDSDEPLAVDGSSQHATRPLVQKQPLTPQAALPVNSEILAENAANEKPPVPASPKERPVGVSSASALSRALHVDDVMSAAEWATSGPAHQQPTRQASWRPSLLVRSSTAPIPARRGFENEDSSSSCGSSPSERRAASLPSTPLMSSLRGSRPLRASDLHVKWAPDVYDPPPTSTSHTIGSLSSSHRSSRRRSSGSAHSGHSHGRRGDGGRGKKAGGSKGKASRPKSPPGGSLHAVASGPKPSPKSSPVSIGGAVRQAPPVDPSLSGTKPGSSVGDGDDKSGPSLPVEGGGSYPAAWEEESTAAADLAGEATMCNAHAEWSVVSRGGKRVGGGAREGHVASWQGEQGSGGDARPRTATCDAPGGLCQAPPAASSLKEGELAGADPAPPLPLQGRVRSAQELWERACLLLGGDSQAPAYVSAGRGDGEWAQQLRGGAGQLHVDFESLHLSCAPLDRSGGKASTFRPMAAVDT